MSFIFICVFVWTGIALYPGKAQLLSCKHHYHDYIPPLVDPGKPQEGDCVIDEVTYFGPFTNQTEVKYQHVYYSIHKNIFTMVIKAV